MSLNTENKLQEHFTFLHPRKKKNIKETLNERAEAEGTETFLL